MEYKIHPLMVSINIAHKGIFTHMVDPSLSFKVPVFIYYLEGGDQKILVDTGAPEGGADGKYNGIPMQGGGPQGVIDALARINVRPEDIDIVILTHLHFDHAANIALFPNANFVVQKTELEYAKSPLPVQEGDYLPEILLNLEKHDMVMVDGDFEVADGVSVTHVPGHTKGQQAVIVNTTEGKYIVAGDLVYMKLNLYPATDEFLDAEGNRIECTSLPGYSIYPPGNHYSLVEWYDSVWRMLAIAGTREHIVPGHCPSIIGKVYPEL